MLVWRYFSPGAIWRWEKTGWDCAVSILDRERVEASPKVMQRFRVSRRRRRRTLGHVSTCPRAPSDTLTSKPQNRPRLRYHFVPSRQPGPRLQRSVSASAFSVSVSARADTPCSIPFVTTCYPPFPSPQSGLYIQAPLPQDAPLLQPPPYRTPSTLWPFASCPFGSSRSRPPPPLATARPMATGREAIVALRRPRRTRQSSLPELVLLAGTPHMRQRDTQRQFIGGVSSGFILCE